MISIVFAYRNRDIKRIRISMDSLSAQSNKEFEVIFVDYGSESEISETLIKLFENYSFVQYCYLNVKQQLWNKSRALNFGIKKASGSHIFIADVDLVFHPGVVDKFRSLSSTGEFYLFKMGYLNPSESKKLLSKFNFDELKPERFGEVNGMILAPIESIYSINGFDEFFHFYGSEDVDLYSRLNNAGFSSNFVQDVYFYHNWHISYEISDDKKLSAVPKLTDAIRINEQHYLYQVREKIIVPSNQNNWGEVFSDHEIKNLEKPTRKFDLKNILAPVEHFFNEELPYIKNEVIEVKVFVDPYYNSPKFKLKKALKKKTQSFCSLKEVNDLILKQIIFVYRRSNYSYEISKDLNSLRFRIDMT